MHRIRGQIPNPGEKSPQPTQAHQRPQIGHREKRRKNSLTLSLSATGRQSQTCFTGAVRDSARQLPHSGLRRVSPRNLAAGRPERSHTSEVAGDPPPQRKGAPPHESQTFSARLRKAAARATSRSRQRDGAHRFENVSNRVAGRQDWLGPGRFGDAERALVLSV